MPARLGAPHATTTAPLYEPGITVKLAATMRFGG